MNESILHDTLESVLPAFHIVLDGKPETAAVYRTTGEKTLYESDEPIITWDVFQVYVFQREYDPAVVPAVCDALKAAGFILEGMGAQLMQDDYYRDELHLKKRKE